MYAVVQSPSRVQLLVIPQTAAFQASLSLIISQSLPKFTSIASVMASNHLTPLFTTHPMFETNKNAFQIYECY